MNCTSFIRFCTLRELGQHTLDGFASPSVHPRMQVPDYTVLASYRADLSCKRTVNILPRSTLISPCTIPIRIIWPFVPRDWTPASMIGMKPVVSKLAIVPWGTMSRIALVRSAASKVKLDVSITWVAPSSLARSSRDFTLSTPMIVVAPRNLAALKIQVSKQESTNSGRTHHDSSHTNATKSEYLRVHVSKDQPNLKGNHTATASFSLVLASSVTAPAPVW
jgi:hypothetical protein